MTKPLSKEALVRLDWLTALRTQGDRQCKGALTADGRGGYRVCALVLLGEQLWGEGYWRNGPGFMYRDAAAAAGLNDCQAKVVMAMNDYGSSFDASMPGMTFAEIADLVERWFK